MLAVSAALMLLGSIATAQTRAAVKTCAADVETHCGKFPSGTREIADCVKTHLKDFSQRCRAAMQQAKQLQRNALPISNKTARASNRVAAGSSIACRHT
jgi:hypothetical protein